MMMTMLIIIIFIKPVCEVDLEGGCLSVMCNLKTFQGVFPQETQNSI